MTVATQDLQAALQALEVAKFQIDLAEEKVKQAMLADSPNSALPAPLRFDAPVGTPEERAGAKLWPGAWFDATGFNVLYQNGAAYHTGVDLNLPNYADAQAPVYAVADGVVVFAGVAAGWQQKVVIVKHTLEDGSALWSRYAHVGDYTVAVSQPVKRGTLLGHVGDYTPKGPQGDHLHFDLARIDLSGQPADWPGLDRARLLRDYIDPREFIAAHHVS